MQLVVRSRALTKVNGIVSFLYNRIKMPLDNSNSESVRIQMKQNKIKYSNYLVGETRFNNGISSRPGQIISGTGSSGEASALIDINEGTIFISPADQTAIISANTVTR